MSVIDGENVIAECTYYVMYVQTEFHSIRTTSSLMGRVKPWKTQWDTGEWFLVDVEMTVIRRRFCAQRHHQLASTFLPRQQMMMLFIETSCWDQQNHLPVPHCVFLYNHEDGIKRAFESRGKSMVHESCCNWAWLAPKFACCSLWHKILELSPRTAQTGVGNKFDTPRQSLPMIFGEGTDAFAVNIQLLSPALSFSFSVSLSLSLSLTHTHTCILTHTRTHLMNNSNDAFKVAIISACIPRSNWGLSSESTASGTFYITAFILRPVNPGAAMTLALFPLCWLQLLCSHTHQNWMIQKKKN